VARAGGRGGNGTRAVRQRSTAGEHSPVRQYVFSSCLPRSNSGRIRSPVTCFASAGRRGDLVKWLWWDRDGLCLFAKRLEPDNSSGHGLRRAWWC
jgi:hypothetical protein